MGNFVSPAYGVRAVPIEKIVANSYNPNIIGTTGNAIIGTFHLGGWLYDALRLLLS